MSEPPTDPSDPVVLSAPTSADKSAKVTVKTLAAALGVSPATVSNAYNRPDQLSAALRERVLAKAAELGYAGPDAAGRALRVGRSEAVGVLLTERLSYAFSDPFAVEFLSGLSEVVEQHGVSILLMPLSLSEDEPDVRSVQRASIDALTILSLPVDHPAGAVAKARGIRLVSTDLVSDPAGSWVAIDDEQAGALVGEHLTALGHHDVAVVVDTNAPAGGEVVELDAEAVTFVDYASRLRGLGQSLPGRIELISAGHNALASGAAAARWLMHRPVPPTAIVGLSDVLALGALTALTDLGYAVPTDVSVCGFDDIAEAGQNDLTTVAQPIGERGRAVGRLLVDPDAVPRQVLLPIRLVTRASTGPAPH